VTRISLSGKLDVSFTLALDSPSSTSFQRVSGNAILTRFPFKSGISDDNKCFFSFMLPSSVSFFESTLRFIFFFYRIKPSTWLLQELMSPLWRLSLVFPYVSDEVSMSFFFFRFFVPGFPFTGFLCLSVTASFGPVLKGLFPNSFFPIPVRANTGREVLVFFMYPFDVMLSAPPFFRDLPHA